jgi:hypothetical protein
MDPYTEPDQKTDPGKMPGRENGKHVIKVKSLFSEITCKQSDIPLFPGGLPEGFKRIFHHFRSNA